MSDPIEFLIRHGYALVFGSALVDQIGLPIPAIPVLLAAGALVGAGELSFALVLVAAVAGALVGDLLWYELGRRRGMKVVQILCRVSLEPEQTVTGSDAPPSMRSYKRRWRLPDGSSPPSHRHGPT